jgi:hypothetical protein
MARAPMTWLVIPFKLVLNGQKSIRAGDSTVLLAVPVASAGRLRVPTDLKSLFLNGRLEGALLFVSLQ